MISYDLPPTKPDNPFVGLDLETTGLDFHKDEISLVGLFVDGEAFALRWNPYAQVHLDALAENCTFIIHNGFGFDLPFLVAKGMDISKWRVYDTAIGERHIASSGYFLPKSYKNMVKDRRRIDLEKDKSNVSGGFVWKEEQPLSETQAKYVYDDLKHLVPCFDIQVGMLLRRRHEMPKGADELAALMLDQQAVIPTAYLNASILPLDYQKLARDFEETRLRISELQQELGIKPSYSLGRETVAKLLAEHGVEYTHKGMVGAKTLRERYPSPVTEAIARALLLRTEGTQDEYLQACHDLGLEPRFSLGATDVRILFRRREEINYEWNSVSKDKLELMTVQDMYTIGAKPVLSETAKLLIELLDARTDNSKRAALLQQFQEHQGLRSTYMLSGAGSGRYTAKGEMEYEDYAKRSYQGKRVQQAQNIKREFRPLYIASKDKWFLILDYAQQELRIQAALYDPEMTAVLVSGEDLYQRVADLREIDRFTAKVVTLALCYGIGRTKASQLYTNPELRKAFPTQEDRDSVWYGFRDDWPSSAKRVQSAYNASNSMFSPTRITIPGGMTRLLQPRSGDMGTVSPSDLLNTPIQGAAGAASKRALVTLVEQGFAKNLAIALHDEFGLIFDSREEAEGAQPLVEKIMSEACRSVVVEAGGADIEFPVESTVAQSWEKP